MTVLDAVQVAATMVVALGGGGGIVFGLSGFLGKVWADRLMANEKAEHDKELERLRADLTAANTQILDVFRAEVELSKSKRMGAHDDKVQMYKLANDMLSEMMADFGTMQVGRLTMNPEDVHASVLRFDRQRMRIFGYLGMFAPQHVIDAYHRITDHFLAVIEGSVVFEFATVRALAIGLINEARIDLGVDPSPIQYRGVR